MELVETKTYTFKISIEERKQLGDIADKLQSIAREINDVIGEDYPIVVGEYETYTGEELWRAAELLNGIACGNYQI